MRPTLLCLLCVCLALLLPTTVSAQCSGTWDAWFPHTGPNGEVTDMVSWDPDGAGPAPPLVATGGEFAEASGVTVNNIAAFDVTTRTWIPLGSGTNGRVNAVLALPNGNLLIGGAFSSAGGVACNNLAEWNGATWSAFASGTNNEVFALLMLANGDIVVGGAFTMAGTVPCNRIAKWNWSTWSSYGSGMDGSVRSLAAWPNGTL
ncbi:MAG: hypothetical protein KA020_13675, partial [Planctomycetes bacterium]|nr:hypothetical protein [Planctomycetota bacterium]